MKKFNISHTYNNTLYSGGVYDVDESRSYICAALNPLRFSVMKKLDMKQNNFLLSTSYILYYDLLNKANRFIDAYKSSLARQELLKQSDFFEGSYFDAQRVIKEYGIVPLSAMPDRSCNHEKDVKYALENYLRYCAKCIDSGIKEDFESGIINVLSDTLGNPPEKFSFSFMNNSGEIENVENVSPNEFYNKFCDIKSEDYEVFENSDETRRKCAKQIEQGNMVTVCCDIRHQSSKMLGILDCDFIEESDMFSNTVHMTKEDKLHYGIIKPAYYLTLDGAEIQNGDAVRFKAQDCCGADTGADGHYTMAKNWFDEYVIFAVIKKQD